LKSLDLVEDAMEYKVCETNTIDTLHNQIKVYIRDGWRPVGGVAVVFLAESDEWRYFQAMTRGE